jgi:hypothetical protein
MKKHNLYILLILSIFIIQCTIQKTPINKLKISSFVEDSSMQKAGAQEGDFILKYDGKIVYSQNHLIELKNLVTTEEVNVVLLRNDKKLKIKVPVGQLGAILQEYNPDHIINKNAVIIDGIGKLDWGNGMDNSFLACVYLLEQKFGNQLSYTDIVGLSGYGFRLNFFDRFCPSSPDATVGFDSGGYLMQKLGYKVDYYHLQNDDLVNDNVESMAEEGMRMLILDSIDRGWPVIAIDMIETPEWGLITGYQNKDTDFFCRTFFDKTEGYEKMQKFPWIIMVIKDKIDTEIEPLYSESLQLAKQLYETPKYDDYLSGINALQEWISALKDEQYYAENLDSIQEISHANWWIFVSLEIARGICNKYLSENIDKFDSDTKMITKLAQIYEAEASLLIDNYAVLPNQFAQALQPWTTEMRAKQIDVMEDLLVLEEQAYKIIKSID